MEDDFSCSHTLSYCLYIEACATHYSSSNVFALWYRMPPNGPKHPEALLNQNIPLMYRMDEGSRMKLSLHRSHPMVLLYGAFLFSLSTESSRLLNTFVTLPIPLVEDRMRRWKERILLPVCIAQSVVPSPAHVVCTQTAMRYFTG